MKAQLKKSRFLRFLYYYVQNLKVHYGYTSGKNNKVSNLGVKVGTRICINGSGNKIIIEKNALLNKVSIYINGSNNQIKIGVNAFLESSTLHIEDDNCSLQIGENSFVGKSEIAVTENNGLIKIGNDCMLSSNVYIRNGDSHSIIDLESNQRINQSKDIEIGNHCWIGEGAKILKGIVLHENVIVATGAIVTKSFEADVLVGGNPAKILKSNITWDKSR